MRARLPLVVSALVALAAASPSLATEGPAPAPTPSVAPDRVANVDVAPAAQAPLTGENALATALREKLGRAIPKQSADDKDDRAALNAYYAEPGATELWVGKTGLNERATAVIAEIRKADDWGLEASEFALPAIVSSSPTEAELADAEIGLSLAVLKYARHARGGRISEPATQLSSYIDRKPQLKAPAEVLREIAKAAAADEYLRMLNPQHAGFLKLKDELAAIRTRKEAVKAQVKVPKGPTLKPGKSHADIAVIRQRLEVPVPSIDGQPGDAKLYDDALLAKVKAFQAEKGVSPADGTINAATRNAMNAEEPSLSERKIVANMEAWRWMPADLGDFYVWVNIPEFTVRVVKDGKVIHSERVITGKIDTQTPVFSDEMKTVVFHPFWGVPESIKVKELWPGLVRGGDSLARNGLRMQSGGRDVNPQSIDWSTANIKNFHVYQPPGPGNVLGVVKFMFPNKHQVYMHDTPTKHLFATKMRTYSHGCMRVRNPVRLAEVLLDADKGWDAARVASVLKSGPQNNEIALSRKIPVHVTYFTAWVDDATGKAAASTDFYGHEERIALALEGKWNRIARGRDHLAPVRAEPIARLAESRANAKPQNALGDFFNALFGGN